jgi:hypothetical protein
LSADPKVSILALATEPDWIDLHDNIAGFASPAVANLLEQLKVAGAGWALVEEDYLDRDFSEEHRAFYGRLFRHFPKRCRRFHFFAGDLPDAGQVAELAAQMEEACCAGRFLGFAVIRPVRDAPLGRAVVKVLQSPDGVDARIQVRARYETHPLGATLSIWGVPLTQQDRRISACAQASIWVSGRHFLTRHNGPWFSTVGIGEAASQPTDMTLAMALPAGSAGLNANNMLRALRAMDRYPYAFAGQKLLKPQPGGPLVAWPAPLDPAHILSRYVGSGLPVILGLVSWEGGGDGHAVTVVGDSFRPASGPLGQSKPNLGALSPHFLVHDDQRGPNLRMPVERDEPLGETPYNVRDHAHFIIVPLPDKVFMPAEVAEAIAWDYLRFHLDDWPGMRAGLATDAPSVALGDAVAQAARENGIVARTYLTHGWKHKERILAGGAALPVRELIASASLPRMIWVTEFGRLDDLNKLDPEARRIFGHSVMDATSPEQGPPLIFHAPGHLTHHTQVDGAFFLTTEPVPRPISDDVLYKARARKNR